MAEAALLLFSPSPMVLPQLKEGEEGNIITMQENDKSIQEEVTVSDQTLETKMEDIAASDHDETQEDASTSDAKHSQDHGDQVQDGISDQEEKPTTSEEMGDVSSIIQTLKDNDIIPPSLLEGIPMDNFPASDLPSALKILGARYHSLMNKYQDQSSELEALGTQFEILRKKCLEECKPTYDALMKKYNKECSERKLLYNEIIELKGNIRVFCRCRPLSPDEISKGFSSAVEFDPSQDKELQIICSDTSRKQFKFDHVFGPQDNQEAVFAETLPIIKSVLDGYNACIFAYGQTGTGKTFTMEGTAENRGVNFRTLEELFRISQERNSTVKYEFFVSMLEVYNEKIRDLLAENSNQQTKKLEVKQAAEGTQEVPGLVEAQAYNIDEVWNLLKTGQQNRSVGSTNANELSSRSHCLVRVTVKEENSVTCHKSKSNLWLVDLAGSERVGKIEVEGERLKESQFINKSLSALGDVISALASKNPHIPYRNSKLTHLLQSSLGGDCKTLMIVQISPSSADVGETLCSLNFATRVRGIELGPVRKLPDPVESFKYKQMAERLRQEEKETARLNESLQLMHLKYASRENVFKSLQEKVRDLESQLADARKTRHQLETKDSAKYHRPPLPPMKQRLPLSRISNNYLPPPGPRRNSFTNASRLADKENISMGKKAANTAIPPRPAMKARRVSLTTLVRPTPLLQPKRRVSVAALPSQMFTPLRCEKQNFQQENATNQLPRIFTPLRCEKQNVQQDNTTNQQLPPPSRLPRKSLASFNYLPGSFAMRTPDAKGKIDNFAGSNRYFSPPQMQQTGSKMCFSIQRRVLIGSPAQPARPMLLGAALRDKEIVGKLGTAQRILCKNRRRSVI